MDITTYLAGAAEIANFAKIKYTRPTILSEQQSRRATQQKCNAQQSELKKESTGCKLRRGDAKGQA